MSTDPADAVFWALADGTRREVMQRISTHGAASATEIASELPISRQAVSKHLSTLAGAGLVDFEVRGREKRYRLTPQPFGEAMSWMADVGSEWDGRLEALKALLSRPPP